MKKILILLLFISSINLFSEDKPIFYYGIWAGYGINFHHGGFSDFPQYPGCCGEYESGIGGGFALGGLFEYPLNDEFSLSARIGWKQLNGRLTTEEAIGNTEIRDNAGLTTQIVDAVAEYSIDGNISAITFEPAAIYKITNQLGITGGLSLGYLLNSTFDRVEEIQSPDNIIYLNTGTRQRNEVIDGEIPESNQIQLRIFAGLNYDLPLSKSLLISPEIRYYFPITQIRDDWSVSTLHLGLALKAPVYPPRPIQKQKNIYRDTTVIFIVGLDEEIIELISSNETIETKPGVDKDLEITTITEKYERRIPKKANLYADLKLIGIDENGNEIPNPTLIIEEIQVEESFPILPYIYFDENSSDLTSSKLNLYGKDDFKSFDSKNLNWNTLDIYQELLNIVAERMLQNPNAKITIVGTNKNIGAEENNLNLSNQRAMSVKSYLTDVCGISQERIIIKAQNLPDNPSNNDRDDGLIENQRAEIYSDNWEILKPIYLKSIEKIANPPKVEITPIIQTDEGIKSWAITVNEEGKGLRNYSGVGIPEPILWDVIQSPEPKTERTVNVEMQVNDKIDQSVSVYKDLTVNQLTIQKKKYEMLEDKQIQRYSLIVFDYNKDELTPAHKRILDELKEKISPKSKVKIYGYADRTGEKSYNRELAKRRADKVANYLNLDKSNYISKGIGNDEILYDNDLPPGRAYSRTVKIIIETPIE